MKKILYLVLFLSIGFGIGSLTTKEVLAESCCDFVQGEGCIDYCGLGEPDPTCQDDPSLCVDEEEPSDDEDEESVYLKHVFVAVMNNSNTTEALDTHYDLNNAGEPTDPEPDWTKDALDGSNPSHPGWDILNWCEDQFYKAVDNCNAQQSLPALCQLPYPAGVLNTDGANGARIQRLRYTDGVLKEKFYYISAEETCGDGMTFISGGERYFPLDTDGGEGITGLYDAIPLTRVSGGRLELQIPGFTIRYSGSKLYFGWPGTETVEGESFCWQCTDNPYSPSCKVCPRGSLQTGVQTAAPIYLWFMVSPTQMCSVNVSLKNTVGTNLSSSVTLNSSVGGSRTLEVNGSGVFDNVQPVTNNYPVGEEPTSYLSVTDIPGYVNIDPTYTISFSSGTGTGSGGTGLATSPFTINESAGCSANVNFVFTQDIPPSTEKPWWQVKDADVISGGDISSNVPTNFYFNLAGAGGSHGLPIAEGNINADTVSESPLWMVENFSFKATVPDFYYLFKLAQNADVAFNTISDNTISEDNLPTVPDTNGYDWYWYNSTGELNITGLDLSNGTRKLIIFAGTESTITSRNVKISGTVKVGASPIIPDGNFVMIITDGNITIDPSVANMEGIFFADGATNIQSATPADDIRFYLRGSLISKSGVTLGRSLGTDNATTSAEYFEFAPDLVLDIPNILQNRTLRWREVAPVSE